MERRLARWMPTTEYLVPLGVLALFFFVGGIVGLAFASSVEGEGGELLTQYLSAYLELAAEGTVPVQPLAVLWEQLKLPLCALLLGFSALGLVGLPILMGIRGFSLVYAVACFCRIFGSRGLVVAGFLFGVTAVITVPALFVLGVQGMQGGYGLLLRSGGRPRTPLPYDGDYLLRCGICLLAVGVAVVLEWLVVPSLLISAAPLIL